MQRVRQLDGVVGRLRLQRGCVCGPPTSGLHGASDTALATALLIPLEDDRILWQR